MDACACGQIVSEVSLIHEYPMVLDPLQGPHYSQNELPFSHSLTLRCDTIHCHLITAPTPTKDPKRSRFKKVFDIDAKWC